MIELFIKSNMENIKYSKSYKPCFHSEISAILKLGKEDCSDIEFFNIRIDNNGNIASSKPCANCMNMLRTMGFKRIYYTNS